MSGAKANAVIYAAALGVLLGAQAACAGGLPQAWIGSGARVRDWNGDTPAERVRLSLRHAGIYRVTAAELAAAGGWDGAAVAAAIAATNMALTCRGAAVAWQADGNAMLFHGRPADTFFAPENVYWVEFGAGLAMARQAAAPAAGVPTNSWFVDTVEFAGTNNLARQSESTLTNLSYVAFAPFITTRPVESYALHGVTLPNPAPGTWEGDVSVSLLSCHEASNVAHEAQVLLGGVPLGGANWEGEGSGTYTFTFSSTNMNGNSASLVISNTRPFQGTVTSRLLCSSFSFSYPRRYVARQEQLICRGAAGGTIDCTGFADEQIMVFNITETNAPVLLDGGDIGWRGGGELWGVVFAANGSQERYCVVSRGGFMLPSVRGAGSQPWPVGGETPQYAILIPPEGWIAGFREKVAPLAEYRNHHGLRTVIIDVEDIYNTYSHGLADPQAIRLFCAAAFPYGLRYLLLAGAGSFDFRHQAVTAGSYTAALIPTFIAGQSYPSTTKGMSVALDPLLGDVNGDLRPDVAVGRFPVASSNELEVVVAKTLAYEEGVWRRKAAVLCADWNNTGSEFYDFHGAVDRLLPPLAAARRTSHRCYVENSGTGIELFNTRIRPLLQDGVSLFYFMGHSNELTLGDGTSRVLYDTTISSDNWQKPFVMFAMGCRASRWQTITTTRMITVKGLITPNTGFAAAVGATGNMTAADLEEVAVKFFEELAGRGVVRLGDAHREALNQRAGECAPERLFCLSLTGDPALAMDVPGTGTVVAIN